MSDNLITSRNLKVNVRLRDFFVDFLACLIPGFIVLSILSLLFVGISILFLTNIEVPDKSSIQTATYIVNKLHNKFNFTFWIHVAVVACSYSFGFLLFRQDPKKPDYASYIRIRNLVYGYNDWVIPKDEGLSPKEVQFPYSNLAEYLKHRGFDYLVDDIYWKNEKNRRSKSFINQLKTRISFYFPDSTFQIIKNEAHIRFSSSMWYGMKLIISALYATLIIFLIIDKKGYDVNLIIIIFLIIVYIFTKFKSVISNYEINDHNKIISILIKLSDFLNSKDRENEQRSDANSEEMKKNIFKEKGINILAGFIRNLDFVFNISPFIASLVIATFIYVRYNSNDPFLFLSFIFISIILLLSLSSFYVLTKIEDSFHYQRVREIIYVLETANVSNINNKDSLELLWETKCLSNENEFVIKNTTKDSSDGERLIIQDR